MEEYLITRRHTDSEIIPEIYHMDSVDGDILFLFPEATFASFCRMFEDEKLREDLRCLKPETAKQWGYEDFLPPVKKIGKDFVLTISTGMQVISQNLVCVNISSLCFMISCHFMNLERTKSFGNSDSVPQLFHVAPSYFNEPGYHHGALSFSVSPEATQCLLKNEGQEVPNAKNLMVTHHLAFTPQDKKFKWLPHEMEGKVRSCGTLSYRTFGNCACLSTAPKERTDNRGYEISSHNVDSKQQQLSLIVGIAATWAWVRKELGYT